MSKALQPDRAVSPERALQQTFLKVFLRGQSARGLTKDRVPTSIAKKLLTTLLLYALIGATSLAFIGQHVFAVSAYLHGVTFLLVAMFVVGSAGEALFNREEADILMHRPVTPRAVLFAKVSVLIQVSFYIGGAYNLIGLIVGSFSPDGGWMFLPAHALSTAVEAVFCAGSVVLAYQLCLRWFGRERLDSMMTTGQIIVMSGVTVGSQLLPRMMSRTDLSLAFGWKTWWLALVPPAWFAGLDDAVAGQHSPSSWALGSLGLGVTALVVWLALGRLAGTYQTGVQVLNEASESKPKQRESLTRLKRLTQSPPLNRLFKDPIERSAFLLVAAYLGRDRDLRLRVFPGLSPFVMMPVVLMFAGTGSQGGALGSFTMAFSGAYLCLVPVMATTIIASSQQYRAFDAFRTAPIVGPGPLCLGGRTAVLLLLTLPLFVAFSVYDYAVAGWGGLAYVVPFAIALPALSLMPYSRGASAPLSEEVQTSRSATGCLLMAGTLIVASAVGGVTYASLAGGWYWWFIGVGSVLSALICHRMKSNLKNIRWKPQD